MSYLNRLLPASPTDKTEDGTVLKGRLPACTIDKKLLDNLWEIFQQDGEFLWTAAVGTGGDLLGKQEERPQQNMFDWPELIRLLETLPRIDSLIITFEVADKGSVAISFKNYTPSSGMLVINGQAKAWVEDKFCQIKDEFIAHQDSVVTKIYSMVGFSIVQTVIPLSSAFLLVMLAAAFLIPVEVRRSAWVWWITAGTVVATLRLAYSISDRLIIYVLRKYPYIRFS